MGTSGRCLREEVDHIDAGQKALTTEEGPLAFWMARALREDVDQVFVCDPRETSLISRSARKDDVADAKALARLLRKLSLGERSRKCASLPTTGGLKGAIRNRLAGAIWTPCHAHLRR